MHAVHWGGEHPARSAARIILDHEVDGWVAAPDACADLMRHGVECQEGIRELPCFARRHVIERRGCTFAQDLPFPHNDVGRRLPSPHPPTKTNGAG